MDLGRSHQLGDDGARSRLHEAVVALGAVVVIGSFDPVSLNRNRAYNGVNSG